jgi:hypothetical protein
MDVLAEVREQFEIGASFTARDLKTVNDKNLHGVQSALWMLSKKGYLDKLRGKGSKGRYVLRGRKLPMAMNVLTPKRRKLSDLDPDMIVIERLLNAMAAAEPVIKKWSKVHEALKGI